MVSLSLTVACAPRPRVAGSPAAPNPAPASPAPLDSIFGDTAFAHAHWGVLARSLGTGETLYALHPEKLFLPASVMKLVTGAVALEALGPGYRYRTEVRSTGPVVGAVLHGDLVVWGSGDPSFSTRFAPTPRAAFRAWADSLRARGVTRIEGAVVGVDRIFDQLGYGRGWMWDEIHYGYAAPVGGLLFNEGAIRVRVRPGTSVGAPARVELEPTTGAVQVVNRTVTVPAGAKAELEVERVDGGLVVRGRVPLDAGVLERDRSVPDPTDYFVTVLREVLQEAGIAVTGPAVDADDWPAPLPEPAATELLFAHRSPPLAEILPAMLRPSQNQIAEALLKTLGWERRGEGSAAAGEEVVDSVLAAWEISPHALVMADGSGLSRYNLLTPELLVELLAYMRRSPNWALWRASLPVAGGEGTLQRRLVGTPLEGRLHAKTGTMTGVRALAGYLPSASGEWVAFATIVNHHRLSARDADQRIDALLLRLADTRAGTR